MARDIMSVPVSSVSSESCFSCTARILKDRRRRLLPEHVEMLTCMKDWEQAVRREQHAPEDVDLEEAFKNLFLDGEGEASGSGSARCCWCWIEEVKNLSSRSQVLNSNL